jgi:hypothetical protein
MARAPGLIPDPLTFSLLKPLLQRQRAQRNRDTNPAASDKATAIKAMAIFLAWSHCFNSGSTLDKL